MSLETKVMDALKQAMKDKDDAGKRAIRAIKAAILLKKTDGSGTDLTAEDEIKLLQKMAKQRKESIGIYKEQSRDDLAIVEEEELVVIERFLPEQLGEEEVKALVADTIEHLGASSMKDMGRVMGAVNAKVAGRADGKMIADFVKKALSS